MPIIETTHKLSSEQEEYRVCSKPYVFFRIIVGRGGARLMTATASENVKNYRAFEDLTLLNLTSSQVFTDFGMEFRTKVDRAGRSYVETSVDLDADHLVHVASTALERMGFEDVHVLALQDIKAIYEDLSVGESHEDAYLSDGMWATSDGKLTDK